MQNWMGRMWQLWKPPRRKRGRRGLPLNTPDTQGTARKDDPVTIVPPLIPERLCRQAEDLCDLLTDTSMSLGAGVLEAHRLAAEVRAWNTRSAIQRGRRVRKQDDWTQRNMIELDEA